MFTWKNNIKIPGRIPGWTAGVLTGILFLAAGAVHGLGEGVELAYFGAHRQVVPLLAQLLEALFAHRAHLSQRVKRHLDYLRRALTTASGKCERKRKGEKGCGKLLHCKHSFAFRAAGGAVWRRVVTPL